jgi:acetyl-CoA acetyltransferase
MRDAVIVDAVRTPVGKGKPGGALSGVHPVDLHAHAIRALVERTGIDPAVVDDVISGAVGQIGEQSSNTARWAALAAGLPESVPAVTVDRQCGSSQQAIHFAAQGVIAGTYDVVIASGVESMSRVPIGSQVAGKDPRPGAGQGARGVAHRARRLPPRPPRPRRPRRAVDEARPRAHQPRPGYHGRSPRARPRGT